MQWAESLCHNRGMSRRKFPLKKLVILIAGILISAMVIIWIVALIPYYWYCRALTTGVKNSWIVFPVDNRQLHTAWKPLNFSLRSQNDYLRFWERLHFGNFMIPFPHRHPYLQFVPYLETKDRRGFWKSQRPKLGVQYQNTGLELFTRFLMSDEFPFKLLLEKQKIFQLPVVRNRIVQTPIKKIWEDLFNLDLKLSENPHFDYLRWIFYFQYSYTDLAYRLFIYHLRLSYFPASLIRFQYYLKNEMGIITMVENNRVIEQHLYVLQNGMLYKFELVYRKDREEAQFLARYIISQTSYRQSSPSSSKSLYENYKNLPFTSQFTNNSLKYFYAAWSHQCESEDFTKAFIQYVEQGKDVYYFLDPLYDYALKTFGSTFSSREIGLRKEGPERRLQRKKREELERELEQEKENPEEEVPAAEFTDKKARVEYFLEQAKDQGINVDAEEAVIFLD